MGKSRGTSEKLKMKASQGDIDVKIARYLFTQHTTPTAATGQSPAERMDKKLRTNLDNIHPHFAPKARVIIKSSQQQLRSESERFRKVTKFCLRKPQREKGNG